MSDEALKQRIEMAMPPQLGVLRAAWRRRRELDGEAWRRDEAEFLPAALALQAAPPHPVPRALVGVLSALVMLGLLLSWFGKVDVHVVAPGRVVVAEGTKLVQPVDTSVVRRVLVHDGDRVEAGQLLIELDATEAQADEEGVGRQRDDALAEARLAGELLESLDRGAIVGTRLALATTPGEATQAHGMPETSRRLWARWDEIQGQRAQHRAEQARRESEASTHREAIARVEALLPLARQREQDFDKLASEGFVAAHAGQDRRRERIELERELALATARWAESRQALRAGEQADRAAQAALRRELVDRQAEAQNRHAVLEQQGRKAARREQLTRLLAPVAGTVQQLAVHTEGGVVTPAQTLLVIVPHGAPLTAEVLVQNKDVGDLRLGQDVEVKVEAFPFARHGTVAARLTRLARDAVVDEQRGAVYPATITIEPRSDGPIALAAGMNVEAEIAVGRRRLIAFFLPALEARVDGVFSVK